MTEDWKSFLLAAGAELTEDETPVVSHFGNPQRERQLILNGTAFCDLSNYSLIRVSGDDAESFLQGQLSNDISKTDANSSQLSAYCSPKGRVLALLRIVNHGDGYTLILPEELEEKILARLKMYVMMSKVDIDIDPDQQMIGLSGPNADEELQAISGIPPQSVNDVQTKEGITYIRIEGETPRSLIVAVSKKLQPLWNDLNVNSTPVGTDLWSYLDVLAGTPQIGLETYESQVPQMINLDLIGAIDFKKGCYPGQEIVARMHYLGKLKKRLYFLDINSSDTLAPGTGLYSPAGRSDEPIGMIINSSHKPDGQLVGLGVVQKKIVEARGKLHLEGDESKSVVATIPNYTAPGEFEF